VPAYLVERYWPGVTSELLLEAISRGRGVMKRMGAEGVLIREIVCVLVPDEEVVFSLYEGTSAVAVLAFNQRAGLPVSRIVAAIAVTLDES
jgi:hypothetical protein